MQNPDFQSELKLLMPGSFKLWRDERMRLFLEMQANRSERVTFEDIRPARSFPLTDAGHWIAMCDVDGKHLGIVRDLAELDLPTRELLHEELAKRYFIPTITEVVSFRIKMGVHSWDVVTDRGARSFDVRERDDYRLIPPTRLLIRDVDGNRYEIENYMALDAKTVDLIEQVL